METAHYKNLIRIFVDTADFAAGLELSLPQSQAHYLKNVMRKGEGDVLRVFNGRDGEFLAEITAMGKKEAKVVLTERIRGQEVCAGIIAAASPVKKDAFDLMVEKACELGAPRFIPVLCDRTIVRQINKERLQAIAIEAAEQSERNTVMQVEEPVAIKTLVKNNPEMRFIVCLERADAPNIAKAVAHKNNLAVIIGPEGGFSEDEAEFFTKSKNVTVVSLGKNILRAETALISALAIANVAEL